MYDKIKVLFNIPTYRYIIIIGGIGLIICSDISSISQVEPTISVPLSTWNELKNNNARALRLNRSIQLPLDEAQSLVMKQREELNEAHNTINRLRTNYKQPRQT